MGAGIVNVDLKDILSNAGSIFTGFGSFITSVREVITGKKILDPNESTKLAQQAAELEGKMKEMDQTLQLGQLKINEIEAGNASIFVSGWRPAIGWICGLGLFTQYFLFPIISWALPIFGHPEIALPIMDVGELYPLLFGMLGFGGMRMYEKVKGVASK